MYSPNFNPFGVDVVGHRLDAVPRTARRELRRVDHPPAELVDIGTLATRALIPEIVHIHVPVADVLQPAAHHRVGLSLDLRRRRSPPDEAPATPPEQRREPEAVVLRTCRRR